MKFIVFADGPRFKGGKPRYRGALVKRWKHIEDPVQRIFAHIHHLGAHSPQWKKWKNAERAMVNRYMPRIWKLVEWGIKKERI